MLIFGWGCSTPLSDEKSVFQLCVTEHLPQKIFKVDWNTFSDSSNVEVLHFKLKLSMFCVLQLYLKIINTFSEK